MLLSETSAHGSARQLFLINQRKQEKEDSSKPCFMGSQHVLHSSRARGVLMVWGHLTGFIKKLRQEGEDGGGAGGGSGKCKLIGSKRILMFTAAFPERHLAHI